MVNYRRNKPENPKAVFFLVFNTFKRHPWIAEFDYYDTLTGQMKRAKREFGVRFPAWVILPDHMHWLIQPGKADYSIVVSAYKRWATWDLKKRGIIRQGTSIWQDRFWEETIRDYEHYSNCVDYIHLNPVKHGLVRTPWEWQHSSFRQYVKKGLYLKDWGTDIDIGVFGTKYD
jgi:putative transposase